MGYRAASSVVGKPVANHFSRSRYIVSFPIRAIDSIGVAVAAAVIVKMMDAKQLHHFFCGVVA